MDTATNAPGVICVANVLALIETQCEKLRLRECFLITNSIELMAPSKRWTKLEKHCNMKPCNIKNKINMTAFPSDLR